MWDRIDRPRVASEFHAVLRFALPIRGRIGFVGLRRWRLGAHHRAHPRDSHGEPERLANRGRRRRLLDSQLELGRRHRLHGVGRLDGRVAGQRHPGHRRVECSDHILPDVFRRRRHQCARDKHGQYRSVGHALRLPVGDRARRVVDVDLDVEQRRRMHSLRRLERSARQGRNSGHGRCRHHDVVLIGLQRSGRKQHPDVCKAHGVDPHHEPRPDPGGHHPDPQSAIHRDRAGRRRGDLDCRRRRGRQQHGGHHQPGRPIYRGCRGCPWHRGDQRRELGRNRVCHRGRHRSGRRLHPPQRSGPRRRQQPGVRAHHRQRRELVRQAGLLRSRRRHLRTAALGGQSDGQGRRA